jgi:glycosyltransferase involved in cell wall biosynthesis
MKINIIYPYTNLDFPSKTANMIQTLNTCHALAESGKATVHFILRNPKRWSAKEILGYYGLEETANLFIHSLAVPYKGFPFISKGLNILYKLNLYLKIIGLLRTHPSSFVYGRDINVLSFLVRIKRTLKIKIIYEAHSIQAWFFKNWHTWYSDTKPFPKWKSKWYAAKEERVLKGVDSIVAVTKRLKETVVKEFGVEESKIYVIPDATKLIPLETISSSPYGGGKVVGYVGQLTPSRGVDVLIEAMKYLSDEVELLVVGGGNNGKDLRRLKNLAGEMGLTDRITFTGYIKPRVVANYVLRSDVLVLPLLEHPHSTNFASSLKQFEYMATKKPIVATDLLSTKEILRDRENAILVKPNDPEALASGIRLVLEDKELAKRISENAYKEVCEKYTWEKRAEKILSILWSSSEK